VFGFQQLQARFCISTGSDHDLSSVDAVIDHMRFRLGSAQTSPSCSSNEDADPKD
jgi:hypothetical protein